MNNNYSSFTSEKQLWSFEDSYNESKTNRVSVVVHGHLLIEADVYESALFPW